jgi:SAM-dependent methyltransferase
MQEYSMEHVQHPDHVQKNRVAWDRFAPDYVGHGEQSWATDNPTWGIFAIPESEVRMLPDGLSGRDTVELGCGTAYVSAWLARRGARPVGIDNSPNQLATARRLQTEHDLAFPLHLGNAEQTPFPDASFDLAISEYGASIWCDPYAWIPEAGRLLRPGGRLHFLVNGTLVLLCTRDDSADDEPPSDRFERPYFGMHRIDWPDGSVQFHLGYGDWIRLLRANGFEVEDMVELRPAADATTSYPWMTTEWARKWPCEEVWKARKQ